MQFSSFFKNISFKMLPWFLVSPLIRENIFASVLLAIHPNVRIYGCLYFLGWILKVWWFFSWKKYVKTNLRFHVYPAIHQPGLCWRKHKPNCFQQDRWQRLNQSFDLCKCLVLHPMVLIRDDNAKSVIKLLFIFLWK